MILAVIALPSPSIAPSLQRQTSCTRLIFRLGAALRWVPVLLLHLMLSVGASAQALDLTESERAYVHAHPSISLCVDPDWWPFESIDETGKHVGIAADLIERVAQHTGLVFELHRTLTWEDSLKASKAGECLAMSFLNQTPNRDEWLIFTAPLLEDPNVFITREEHPFISDVAALSEATIALPKGTAMAERFGRDFPHIRILYTDSEAEALRLVSERQADMTLRSLIVAAHTIKEGGWFNLKISGQIPGYSNALRMGVLKSEETLRSLLDKGIARLTTLERRQIIDRHVSMTVVSEVVTDYTFVYGLGATLLAVLGTSLVWMRRLAKLNKQLETIAETDPLTGLPNRNALNAHFHNDLLRAHRFGRPLAVILLDIDHFKHINDRFGHVVGDKVLTEFGRIVRSNLRDVDSVCRWGGEEFLILCAETDASGAMRLAERILAAVRSRQFSEVGGLTCSAGVAALAPEDQSEGLIRRADAALYEAKQAGRDRARGALPQIPGDHVDPVTSSPSSEDSPLKPGGNT